MNLMKRVMLVACACVPFVTAEAQAAVTWSSCQTVTAVSNYLAYNNSIYLTLSPGISGCTGNSGSSVSAVGFLVGQEGVASTNIQSLLATSLAAMAAGSQVMIFYDTSTAPQCYSQIVAVHGFAAQCP
jgi:hypothetical protein